MSGQQIGVVVGGAVGAFFGGGAAGAQLGMAIGGFIGGLVDPTKINGPHIGDGQQQSATDGAPIAWVQGTSPFIAGTIIDTGARYEVKVKDSGKGGPTVSHYEAHQSFAILICESSAIKGSTISQVLMVEQDGKIVYDVRPGSTILDSSANWAKSVDFLYGAEDQMPHPTLEAIHGVGNTNPYRGRCIAVFKDFNLSSFGDRIPTFRFVVTASSGSAGVSIPASDPDWAYKFVPAPVGTTSSSYSAAYFDDSAWSRGPGPFGSAGTGSTTEIPDTTGLGTGSEFWVHRLVHAEPGVPLTISGHSNATTDLWWNGVSLGTVVSGAVLSESWSSSIDGSSVNSINTVAYRLTDIFGGSGTGTLTMDISISQAATPTVNPSLEQIVQNVAIRGGLSNSDVDASALSAIEVAGYPIAKQANAADCLLPILQAYFAFGAEYDGKIRFDLYGANAGVTVDRDDIVESASGQDNASILAASRGQATEYPRKITVSYYDPAQNYMVVNITNQRLSSDVQAIGEQVLAIPVVMAADDAAKAAAKAMKVAYARLEGTREYSVPYVGRGGAAYLSLAPGDPLILDGKRWCVDEMTIGAGSVHLKTTYNRQSAYTSNVQAITGNAPTAPASTLPGATNILPMNLPSLRPQDTFGIYVAASGVLSSWPGATIQISYDDGASWSNAFDTSYPCIMGDLTAPESSGTLSVAVNGTLESITDAQLSVGGNAAAVIGPDGLAEIIQFKTSTETSSNHFDLTYLTRGALDTHTETRASGDQFAMLDVVHFIPIAQKYAGLAIKLRGVTYGTAAEDAAVVSIVYSAIGPVADTAPILWESGTIMTTELGIAIKLE